MRLRIILWVFLALLISIVTTTKPRLWEQLSSLIQDSFIQNVVQDKHIDQVVLIDIDEASLEMVSTWPWSRSLMASLITKTSVHYNAAAIGLDLIFPEITNATEDSRLVQAIQDSKTSTAIVWDYRGRSPPLQVGSVKPEIKVQSNLPLPQAKGYLANFSALAAVGNTGHISLTLDANNKIRYVAPLVNWQKNTYPMLALTILAQAQGKHLHPVMRHNCLYPFAGQARALCLNSDGLWEIPYRYQRASFTVIPAWQIILETAHKSSIEHRQVIIGSSALGLSDRAATPLASVTPSMIIHAQILAGLQEDLQSNVLAGPNLWAWLTLSLVLLSVILMRSGIMGGLLLVLCASVLWLFWVNVDYQKGLQLPDIALPILIMLFWLASQSALEWSLVKRQSQRIYRLFEDYLPPHLLKQAIAQPDERMLLPQQRRVTILFADIAGFTGMTEQLPTEEAAQLTRHILSLLTKAVYDQDGTLDKYMGDALMAFWNAPLNQADHAKLAVDAALSMRSKIQQLNEIRAKDGLTSIHIRIGINTGDVLVGDLGTQWRHAYTVLGDAVNVAQRLMMASTQLGVDIAIGESAAQGLDNSKDVGEMHLQGRTRLERVFVIPITINTLALRYTS